MQGYVINKSNIWLHAMKRAIGPGQKVELGELYEQYGVKHGLAKGEEFAQWLRDVKLKDKNKWRVILETEQTTAATATKEVNQEKKVKNDAEEKIVVKEKKPVKADRTAPFVPTKMGVADVVGLSVRQGREVLPKITDLNLLKYALQEANQMAGKDSLCREIRKRIRALQIAR